MMRLFMLFGMLSYLLSNATAQPKINMTFVAGGAKFTDATLEYEQIWAKDGEKIINALEKLSGMRFLDTAVTVIIMEVASTSGYMESPMLLRASYPVDIKKGTLIHELGHRLQACLGPHQDTLSDHDILFMYLYDVWTDLYGEDFAKQQVAAESRRKNPTHDYQRMWQQALAGNREQRQKKIREFVAKYRVN
jgi:hypothetical protein